jgi:hypothetical protein
LVSEVRAFTEATVTGAAGKASAESVEKGRGDAAALFAFGGKTLTPSEPGNPRSVTLGLFHQEADMKKLFLAGAIALLCSTAVAQTPAPKAEPKATPAAKAAAPAAPVAAPMAASGATCKGQAADKKLAGAAMTSFMKKCQADASKTCEADSKSQNLKGAAKTSHMKKCVNDAVGA